MVYNDFMLQEEPVEGRMNLAEMNNAFSDNWLVDQEVLSGGI